ncbi:MAG: hypothetical protein EZS28_007166, partial [Streblomastix strix]
KRINEEEINIESIGETSDGSLAAFHLPEYELGVIYITSFAPEDISDFQSNFFDIVKQLSDTTGSFYSKKLLIDLRYNGGGYGRLAYILTRFLFPHVDSPIWEPMDLPKSNIGKIFTKITDFSIRQEQLQELQLDEATGEVIYDYYQQEGSQRTTKYTDDQGTKSSITVDLTKKATFYAGHVDELRQIASDWNLRRKTIWQPKDVTVLLEGLCISTCADFTKIIHQKRAARIVTIGNFGGVQDGDRYNAGTAGGSSIQNSDTVDETYQKFLDDPTFGSTVGFDESDFPGQFYREGTSLSYVDTEFYGITEESKDRLSEFNIFDADFHINFVENYGYQNDWELSDYADLYAGVVTQVDSALNGDESSTQLKMKQNADQSGCFSGEVEIKGWLSQTECLDKVKSDPDSIYGYRCEASQNRNPDGTRSIGKFVKTAEGCIFSNCRPGYSRKWDKCVKDTPLLGETEAEIRPDTLEQEYQEQLKEFEAEEVTTEEEKKTNKWKVVGIVFIVIAVIAVAALVVIVVALLVRWYRKKSNR